MKVLKFNIYCNTAKEAIAEINALMFEYKEKILEFNVNIMLDEQKEPIDLTIDSDELAKALRTNLPKDKVMTINELLPTR
ncbi:hypothetical protein [Streptococcus parauberis]|uniref:Conserved domain protein n=1 Tax=Streptococcus parauberis NCFD 2020 TaxID=873447 RepID=F1Z0Y8_9STRE|nr:hypothetical protein [Streptococcus parauberis]EGE54868.1 conserved domain protein [Streptococcus parauberis NCFD 2020]QBX18302.1 hypothetical protein Javan411_0006 [Streptococcus phage Javan411]QBX27645.1 hypothetical protein Javan400_0047 [Streptococcus phage Javan400]